MRPPDVDRLLIQNVAGVALLRGEQHAHADLLRTVDQSAGQRSEAAVAREERVVRHDDTPIDRLH